MKLDDSFYIRQDVVQISRELLGKVLVTRKGNKITSGIITETEAYNGVDDKASHAYNNRRTPRTEIMYGRGGTAYVYLCYGIHSLFNVVTNEKNIPHAVLVRAIQPEKGLKAMLERRGVKAAGKKTFSGPGSVSQALGIHFSDTGANLSGNKIWLEDAGNRILPRQIKVTPRIGVDYAEEDAFLPYRFFIDDF